MTGTTSSRRGFLRALLAAGAASPLIARAERLEASLATGGSPVGFDAGSAQSIRRLADGYLLADDLIYLNHASIGTVPRTVVQAHAGYLELCESYPSLYVWGRVWRNITEDTRAAAARALGCSADDLAITHNTTEGFNILAHGLDLGPGDEVLFSSLNHAGAAVAWNELAPRRGFEVRRFPFALADSAELTVDEVVRRHAEAVGPGTRVVVIPHVDNMIGMTHPVRAIADAVRARGVRHVFVDGAQSAGMIPLSLDALGVDAYAMSPHKWLQAPKGLGLLWTTPELRDAVPRMWHKTGGSGLDGSARKYEDYSTRAWPAVVALGDALDFQAAIGEEEKARRYASLWRHIDERVSADERLIARSPRDPELRSMIVAVGVRGASAPEVAPRLMQEMGAEMRAFGGELDALRVSPNLTTAETDLDRVLEAAALAAR